MGKNRRSHPLSLTSASMTPVNTLSLLTRRGQQGAAKSRQGHGKEAQGWRPLPVAPAPGSALHAATNAKPPDCRGQTQMPQASALHADARVAHSAPAPQPPPDFALYSPAVSLPRELLTQLLQGWRGCDGGYLKHMHRGNQLSTVEGWALWEGEQEGSKPSLGCEQEARGLATGA